MRLRSQRRRASRGCRTSRPWAIRYRTMRQASGRAGRKRLLRREQGTGWSLKHLAHSAEVAPQFGGAFRARWRGKGRHPRSDTAHPRKSRRHLHGLLGRRSHQDQVSEHLCNPRRDSPRSACSFCRWTSNISWMSQCRQSDMRTPLLVHGSVAPSVGEAMARCYFILADGGRVFRASMPSSGRPCKTMTTRIFEHAPKAADRPSFDDAQ
jgi:hypothetical protein